MIKTRIRSITQFIKKITPLTWVMLAFFITFVCFFIRPVFLITTDMVFMEYIPRMETIGIDLFLTLGFSKAYYFLHQTPYNGLNQYPPLTTVLFYPLIHIDFYKAYKIVTFLTLLVFIWVGLILPAKVSKAKRITPMLMLVFVTALFSYGFQFEIERGQFNVIALFLSLAAVWIFHHHHRYRYLAYFFFIIAVQLKVYPFIFAVMLCRDWRDWKRNLLRWAALAAVNVAMLFVLGTRIFNDFYHAISAQMVDPYYWVGNHSIRSFVKIFLKNVTRNDVNLMTAFEDPLNWLLLAGIAGCIGLIIWQIIRQNRKGIAPDLLLVCTLAALMIPAISHDYKLSILAGPVAIWYEDILGTIEDRSEKSRQWLWVAGLFLFSVLYSSTLYSYTAKPPFPAINFPALFLIMLIVTGFSFLSDRQPERLP